MSSYIIVDKEEFFIILDQGISRTRQKAVPPAPQSCVFDIPDQFTLTMDNKRFLLLDETRIRRERLLLFSSDVQLDLLFKSSIIYMDGTFNKRPNNFFQLYIIHAVNFDICKRDISFFSLKFFSLFKAFLVFLDYLWTKKQLHINKYSMS